MRLGHWSLVYEHTSSKFILTEIIVIGVHLIVAQWESAQQWEVAGSNPVYFFVTEVTNFRGNMLLRKNYEGYIFFAYITSPIIEHYKGGVYYVEIV